MRFLKQNTAVKVTVGPFIDKTDGLTPKLTLTVANLVGSICYDDDDDTASHVTHFHPAASGSDNDMIVSPAAETGLWELELSAANTNFTGRMMLCLTDAAQICPVFHEFQVLKADVYDSLFCGTGPTATTLAVNMTQILSHTLTQTGTQVADGFQTFFDTASPVAVSAVATAAEMAKVPKSDSTVSWNATALAAIQSECNDALVANGLDHLVGGSVADTDVADNSIVAKLTSKSATADFTSYVNTTDSLEAQRDNAGTSGAGLTNIGTIATVTTVTNGVSLADDAITASKFDESTAFPLKSADTGATTVARAGGTGTTALTDVTGQLASIQSDISTIDGIVDSILVDTGTTLDAAIAAVKAVVDVLLLRIEADSYIDTATTPWSLVIHKKGDTATVYYKKSLKTSAAVNVSSENDIIGQHIHLA